MLGITGVFIMDRTQLAFTYSTLTTDRPEPGPVLPSQVPVAIPWVASHITPPPGLMPAALFLMCSANMCGLRYGGTVE